MFFPAPWGAIMISSSPKNQGVANLRNSTSSSIRVGVLYANGANIETIARILTCALSMLVHLHAAMKARTVGVNRDNMTELAGSSASLFSAAKFRNNKADSSVP